MEEFIELVEFSQLNRGKIISASDYKVFKRDYEAYISIYRFRSDFKDYVNSNIKDGRPSVANYLGACSASYLWLDIDVEGDLQTATDKMLEVVEILSSKYDLTYKSIVVYYSGSKGYHIGIPTASFGAEEFYSELLPKAFKQMALMITNNSAIIDRKIYNTTRYFRCPMSRHAKTGNYKIPVDVTLILEQGTGTMLEYSAQCQRHQQYNLKVEHSDSLQKLFEECVQNASSNVDIYTDADGYEKPVSLQDNSSIFRLPDKGERNDLIYKMAYRLFSVQDMKVNEVSDLMKFVYELTNIHSKKEGWSRYTEMELKQSINSAYCRTRLKPVKRMKAEDFTSMVFKMFEKIKNSKYIPSFSEQINADLKGGYECGNFYLIIGRGGSMKSYLLQDEVIRTVLNKQVSIIFNLEMSDVTLFDRIWLALHQKSMFEMIQDGDINESNIRSAAESTKAMIEDYLHIHNETDIDPAYIEDIAKQKQDEIKKKVALIGIDSVNGMKQAMTEAQSAMNISKYTKETAKALYCPIILINHANSSCPQTYRDASEFCRGGTKFCDNSDSYMSMSKIVDKDASNLNKEPKDIIYKRGYMYLRFFNKRGSGNTFNKIIHFLPNGRVESLADNPADFEIDETNYNQQNPF